jgi:hypothetical protein
MIWTILPYIVTETLAFDSIAHMEITMLEMG